VTYEPAHRSGAFSPRQKGKEEYRGNGFEQTMKGCILAAIQTVSRRFLTLWMRPE
jgi:hypothetical protein